MKILAKIKALVTYQQDPIDLLTHPPEKVWRKNEWERVKMTVSCKDSDYIPKVKKAGSYVRQGGQKFQLMHNGVKVYAGGYHGEWMQKIIEQLKGHHEPQEEKLFYEIVARLDDTPTILELGSFWAYYSNWLLYARKNARAYCCEPDPHNMKIGEINAKANGVADRVTFIAAAAGKIDRQKISFELDSNQGAFIDTEVRTVDSLAQEYKLKQIDILHMDVQGVELETLEGALQTMRSNKVRFVFVSTHHYIFSRDPLTHQKCKQLLEENGAHIIASHNVLESFSGDGLIVASFDKRDRKLHIPISVNTSSDSLFRPYEEDLAEIIEHMRN